MGPGPAPGLPEHPDTLHGAVTMHDSLPGPGISRQSPCTRDLLIILLKGTDEEPPREAAFLGEPNAHAPFRQKKASELQLPLTAAALPRGRAGQSVDAEGHWTSPR